jgi:gluconokinase
MTTESSTPPLVVVMGVSGAGKSTVGRLLADRLGVPFGEGDDFHSPANLAKLTAGQPLDDSDRTLWLDQIADWLKQHERSGGVMACSALKRRYRDRLRAGAPNAFFVHLSGPFELIEARVESRRNHYMPPSLLHSQFEVLEPLEPDESGAVIPIDATPLATTERVMAALPR